MGRKIEGNAWQFSMRIKDENLLQLLNAVFDRLKDEYGGIRNNFLCDCIKRGCQEIVKEEFDIQDVQENDSLRRIRENTEKISDVACSLSDVIGQVYAHLQGIIALASSNQEMLVGLSENSPKLSSMIEEGFYDKQPPRITKIIQEVFKSIGK